MDVVLIAGGIPKPDEELYEYTQGENKSLLDICGKPMVQWVLDALEQAERVGKIVVVGLEPDCGLTGARITHYLPSQGDLLKNVKVGALKIIELNPQTERVLIASSDIPAITSEMVDWLIGEAETTDNDVYYNVITREVMEARFPNSNRSYVKLKGLELCGGDMNVLSASLISEEDELYSRIVDARKNALKQAALIGVDNLILLLLRVIDLDGAVKRVSKRLHINGRAILCPYAEIGMDIDKPHQLEILREDLEGRA